MHGCILLTLILTRQGGQAMSASPLKYQIPETFSFGLEERTIEAKLIEVDVADATDCSHKWVRRDPNQQTLVREGKTIIECHECKKSVAVYDWKIQDRRN